MINSRDEQILTHFSQIIVAYSAGKDSTVCLLWAIESGLPVRAIMADTGNEPPDTWDYLRYVSDRTKIEIELYQRDGHSFSDLVLRRKMWPIPARCLVSSTTKRDDFKWYLKTTHTPDNALIILGHRRSESKSRRILPDFSPIIRSGRAAYRPILDWSIDNVFTYLSNKDILAHPAYGNGRKRVGCVWCVNSAADDLTRDEELYPQRCAELRELRASIGLSSIPRGTRQTTLFEWPVCRYAAVHCE